MDGTEWKYNYYPDGMRYSKSYGEVLVFENGEQELIVDNGEKATRFVYDNGDIIAETFYSQIFEDDSHVESYVVNGEILNNTLGEIPLGNTTYFNVSFFDDAIEKHGMNAVIAGLIIGGYK